MLKKLSCTTYANHVNSQAPYIPDGHHGNHPQILSTLHALPKGDEVACLST